MIKLFRTQYAYSLHTELLVKNLYVKHRIKSDNIWLTQVKNGIGWIELKIK